MNEIQKIILTCLLVEPEDKKGFRKLQMREQKKAARISDPEKYIARERAEFVKHREERKSRGRKWYRENPEWISGYRKETKDHRRGVHDIWRKNNLPSRAKAAKRYREKYPGASQIRSRIANFLSGTSKNASTPDLLGCELDAFGWWTEAQFLPGMTWENYGSLWEVDHIIPLSWFDQTDLLWQHKAFHFTNTQPLWKTENRAKGNRYVVR